MTSLEWKIHKRLLDAGGKDSSIYICLGRGSGKSETERRLIEELQAEGRTVVHVRLEDLRLGRTFDGVKWWLEHNHEEGLVFWLDGAPVCKIKRSDFGMKWPDGRE